MMIEAIQKHFPAATFPLPEMVYEKASRYHELASRGNSLSKKQARTKRAAVNRHIRLHNLWLANDKRCYICDERVPFSRVTRDHVFPKSDGFTIEGNMMPACVCCNVNKAAEHPTLAHVKRAAELYEEMGLTFAPTRGKHDFIIGILRELEVLK